MAAITYTIRNNSPTTPAVINYFTIATNPAQIRHTLNLTGWDSPWGTGYTAFTEASTLRTVSSTYISNVGTLTKVYQYHTGTSLLLNNNTGIVAGWGVSSTLGYTSGQTVVATSGTSWVITSAAPTATPVGGNVITFEPPQYLLQVNSISGISVGWVISGTGYGSGQTVVATSGTQWVQVSANASSTPSGTITFTSNQDIMATIAPGGTKTFSMNYVNTTSARGTYTSLVNIFATVGSSVIKPVNNYLSIVAPAVVPVVPASPYYDSVGGGGGGDGGGGGWSPSPACPSGQNPTDTGQCTAAGSSDTGKIICTKLYELGLMSKEIYLADQAFGVNLVQASPDIYNGYRAWAEIVVDWMDGRGPKMMPWMTDEEFSQSIKKWSIKWAQDIATPWAEEMAYQMSESLLPNNTGKVIMAIGTPICKVVGVWQRVFGPSKRPAGFVKGAMLISVFVLLKLAAELGRLISKDTRIRNSQQEN